MKKRPVSLANFIHALMTFQCDPLMALDGLVHLHLLSKDKKMSIGVYFDQLAKKIPKKVAVVDQGRVYTYEQVNTLSNKLARNLSYCRSGPWFGNSPRRSPVIPLAAFVSYIST